MLLKSIHGKTPSIPEDCYVAENATIIGDVSFGNSCSVWFNAVIRGDVNFISIGNKVNIQDGAVIHCTYLKHPTIIGNNVWCECQVESQRTRAFNFYMICVHRRARGGRVQGRGPRQQVSGAHPRN